jgi:hypothetical protein
METSRWVNDCEVECVRCDKCERTIRFGTLAEALADGWADVEFGHECPVCLAREVVEQEDVEQVGGLEMLIGPEAAENILGEAHEVALDSLTPSVKSE